MTAHQETAAKVLTVVVFVVGLLLACMALYYSLRNAWRDSGDILTGMLARLLEGRSQISHLLDIILTALPSIAIPVCLAQKAVLTRFGKFAAASLTAIFLLALLTTMILIPNDDSPESKAVAVTVAHSAQLLASLSLTYLGLLFGFKLRSNVY
jgi:hypothetical protein